MNAFLQALDCVSTADRNSTEKQIVGYFNLLVEANKIINFVSRKLGVQGIDEQVADCIYAHNAIPSAESILDIGSGPGLPAVALAILRPASRIFAIESREKPIKFLQSVKANLGLKNLNIRHSRAEQVPVSDLVGRDHYIAVARAFSPVETLIECVQPLMRSGSRLYYLGGQNSNIGPGAYSILGQHTYHPLHPNKVLYEIEFE